ncbi:transmembrane protein 135-like isoform X2 [Cylas formicarius]|nr:transmembrane protein 135-like isoform X2 [Cylas formicarius]XP_060535731.1 transmembrane protein 135-like isoform X2 [Cylas formicarius]
MKGRVPTKEDLRKTLHGIAQSTAFLSFTGFGYSLFLCSLRRLLGHFNVLTVSALPAFLASALAILIERPSRRTLLCLYVSNVATETVWNMLVARHLVRNVAYGDVAIFGASMALLLTYFKGGCHKETNDPMFRVLRFVLGPYEEKDFRPRSSQMNTFHRQQATTTNDPDDGRGWRRRQGAPPRKNRVLAFVAGALKAYKRLVYRLKCGDRHHACPHPFGCLYYVVQGGAKMFGVGFAIQVALKFALNSRRVLRSAAAARHLFMRKETLGLGLFLGTYSAVFRGALCALRRLYGEDRPWYAVPAGLLAAFAFKRYPDTTVALYVMWKAAQITYSLGIQKGYLPEVPGFTELLYCVSTAVLFHAAILEPTNLRPSYWKFLHSISGGRIACMNRAPLDAWGLGTSESLARVLETTKTVPVVLF